MHRALQIAATPIDGWGPQIERLPEGCAHADCGAPRSCRERIAEYLRMQWRIHDHKKAIAADAEARKVRAA